MESDPVALVNQILTPTSGATVTNQQINFDGCSGFFSSGSSVGYPGFPENGFVLSSGNAESLVPPNQFGSTTQILGSGSDPDLAALIPGFDINDACVLEFDVQCPVGSLGFSDIFFDFTFGSDEYIEFS